jgi:hypothetical protein
MNPFITQLAHQASAPLEDMVARLIRVGALIALAAGSAIAASVFLTIDLYLFVESRWGSLIAAASVGGGYLVLAVILLLIALRRPTRQTALDAAPETAPRATLLQPLAAASVGHSTAIAPLPRNTVLAANIDAAVEPVVNVLRDAGLEKEVLAIEAGVEVAKQLNPLWLVAFAVSAGIAVGRALRTEQIPGFGISR